MMTRKQRHDQSKTLKDVCIVFILAFPALLLIHMGMVRLALIYAGIIR